MALQKVFRVLVVSIVLSSIAPAALAAAGIVEHDLLMMVFVPSMAVGLASGWFAARDPQAPEPWAFDDRRMP
jgi:hypothetical protein